jgi:hypothetical protein
MGKRYLRNRLKRFLSLTGERTAGALQIQKAEKRMSQPAGEAI